MLGNTVGYNSIGNGTSYCGGIGYLIIWKSIVTEIYLVVGSYLLVLNVPR